MTKNAWLSLIRHLLTAGGAAVVANNPTKDGIINMAVGVVLSAIGTLWGITDERKADKSALPGL